MTLKIGWLHEAEHCLGTWLHEADDWHQIHRPKLVRDTVDEVGVASTNRAPTRWNQEPKQLARVDQPWPQAACRSRAMLMKCSANSVRPFALAMSIALRRRNGGISVANMYGLSCSANPGCLSRSD